MEQQSSVPEASAAPPGPGPGEGMIEVEQKFLFGPGTTEKLAQLGAAQESITSFRDCYYDRPDWCLTRADHWLRKREGAGWELKCPPRSTTGAVGSKGAPSVSITEGHPFSQPLQSLEASSKSQPVTQYQEVTCPQNIVACICGLLGEDSGQSRVAEMVEELGLKEFASFVTTRHKYRLGDLHVDLDEADFGYSVGEVEALVQRSEDVPAALAKIQQLSSELGFEGTVAVPGKMSAYLHKFSPAHYQILLEDGILQKLRNPVDKEDGSD